MRVKYKLEILLFAFILLVFITGCSNTHPEKELIIRYQCLDGSIVKNIELCPEKETEEIEEETEEIEEETEEIEEETEEIEEETGEIEEETEEIEEETGEIEEEIEEEIILSDEQWENDWIKESTYNLSNLIISIKFYFVESEDSIMQNINIINNRNEEISISSGCIHPISPHSDGCMGWSLRNSENFNAFNYNYIEPNSEINGWVWGNIEEYLKQYNTKDFKASIRVDGQRINFKKSLNNIKIK